MLNGGEEWVIDRSTMSIVKTCDARCNMSPTYRRNERIGWCTVRLANGVLSGIGAEVHACQLLLPVWK